MKLNRWRVSRSSTAPSKHLPNPNNSTLRNGYPRNKTTILDLPNELLELIFAPYENDTITRASLAFAHPRFREIIGGEPWARLNNTHRRPLRHYPHLDDYSNVTYLWSEIGPVRYQWLELLMKDLPGHRFCHACSLLHPAAPDEEVFSDSDVYIGPQHSVISVPLRIVHAAVTNAKRWHRNGRDSACATEPLLSHVEVCSSGVYIIADANAQIRGCELIWNGSFAFTFASSSHMNAYDMLVAYGLTLCEHHIWPRRSSRGSNSSLDHFMRTWLQAPVFSRTLDCRPPHEPLHRDTDRTASTFCCRSCATELEVFTDIRIAPQREGQSARNPELYVKLEIWRNLGSCEAECMENEGIGSLDPRGMQAKHFQPCEHTPAEVLATWPWTKFLT